MSEQKTRVLTDQNGHTLRVIDNEFYALQAERDVLAVTINRLRMAIQSNCYDDPSTSGKRLIELANSIPQQHLAAHDAEVAKAAFIAGVEARRIALLNDEQAAIKSDQYAAQLRAKVGE